MKLERLNNLPFNAVKLNFVPFFVFCDSGLVHRNNFLLSAGGETENHFVSLRLLGGEYRWFSPHTSSRK